MTIFEAIPKVMGEIGAIGKDRKNPQQGYQFRGIDDIYNAAQAALIKHQVFAVPTVLNMQREERPSKSGGILFYTILTIRYDFYSSDGTKIECITIGEAMDSGDKSCNKAMSAAQKYAFLQVFSIPTEEAKDSENETHEVKAPSAAPPAHKLLTRDELLEKMNTAQNQFELTARAKKYRPDFDALSKSDQQAVREEKTLRETFLKTTEKVREGA